MNEINMLDELLLFSNKVVDIPLSKTSIELISYYTGDEFLYDEYSDEHSYILQKCLVEADERYTSVILKNLRKAINTQCGNNVDLKGLDVRDFSHSFRVDGSEKSITRRYKDYEVAPKNEILFKKMWLKKFLESLIQVEYAIRYILEINQPQQVEISSSDEVQRNKYIEIFKNDIGYTIFLDLHTLYKNKGNRQAHYSFLFYALQTDYLVCSGAQFVEFLSGLDIHIDKIDSRQSGTNKKKDLFNSIQCKYQKKHK